MTKEDFIKRAIGSHTETFDYSKVEYMNNKTKVCIICPIHGKFWQSPHNHLKGQGCPKCKNKKISKTETKTTDKFIEDARKVHGDKYDYSKVCYKHAKEKVEIICPKHGEFWQTPSSHLQGCGCPECGKEKTIQKKNDFFTTESFIKRAMEIHGGKYSYDKSVYKKMKDKIVITCPIHGDFEQFPDKHIYGKCGCPKCGGTKKLTTDEFIERAKETHNDKYDYSKVTYVDSHTKVCIVCPEHGEFFQTPNEHLSGSGCPSCSHKISRAEQEIVGFLREHCDVEVMNNVKGILSNNMELDIYIPSKKVAIEYNGMRWHSELFGRDKHYHLKKLEECNSKGIELIQVFEAEYLNNKGLVLGKLLHILGFSEVEEKIYARNCNVEKISKETAKFFLQKNHIQGFVSSSLYLGLKHQGRLVSVMTFKNSVKVENKWELTRFAVDNSAIVNGAGGKLFKHFVKNYKPIEIKSFADRRWTLNGNDNLYIRLGFELEGVTLPDYRYTRTPYDYIHKFNFRKQRLHKKYGLPLEMTETQMTEELGFIKVWDCGLFKYVWKSER